jgi:hypothetical protein
MSRFSSTERSVSVVIACGITPMESRALSGSFDTSCPPTSTRPLVIGTSVVIMRISVLLPAPLGPSRPSVSPALTVKETSFTAVILPYSFTACSTTIAWSATPLASDSFTKASSTERFSRDLTPAGSAGSVRLMGAPSAARPTR